MSSATGQVKFEDGTIMFFRYCGTSDTVVPALFENFSDLWDVFWRNEPHRVCHCNNDEPVEIATNYADGFCWPGRACRQCLCVTKGLGTGIDEYLYDLETDGLPAWWENI